MIAPSGSLVIDPEDRRIARIQGPGLTIALSRQDSYLATALHDGMVREHAMPTAPYTLRRNERLVTSVETSSQRYYARSERTGPGDAWSSAFVIHEKDVLDPLFSIVVASIAPGSGSHAGITLGSPFAQSYRERLQMDETRGSEYRDVCWQLRQPLRLWLRQHPSRWYR